MTEQAFLRLLPTAVLLLTAVLFLPALLNGFVNWNDPEKLLRNPHYRGLGPPNLEWMFGSWMHGNYIPLTWLTFGWDYSIWGMDPLPSPDVGSRARC